MKRKVVITCVAIAFLIGIFIWKALSPSWEFSETLTQNQNRFRKTESYNVSPYAAFGDSSFVLMTEFERTGNHFIEIRNPNSESIVQLRMDFQTGKVTITRKDGQIISFLIDATALARFISIDPLASQYPSLSPYSYVANNPIRLIDPDGREIWISLDGGRKAQYKDGQLYDESGERFEAQEGSFAFSTLQSLQSIEQRGGDVGRDLILALANAPATGEKAIYLTIKNVEGGAAFSSAGIVGEIGFDTSLGLVNENSEIISPTGILAHELGHAVIALQGGLQTIDGEDYGNIEWHSEGGDPYYSDLEEKYVIQNYEQPITQALGTPFNRGQHGLAPKNASVPIVGGVNSSQTSMSQQAINGIADQIRNNMVDPSQTRKEKYFESLRKAGIPEDAYPLPWEK